MCSGYFEQLRFNCIEVNAVLTADRTTEPCSLPARVHLNINGSLPDKRITGSLKRLLFMFLYPHSRDTSES